MYIAHNILAANASTNLGIVKGRKAKSSEKLSSGYRINRAVDDAAGLCISEGMRGQIRGLKRGSQNLHDAINYVRVADGALSQVDDILQRMRELAVQANNTAIYTEADRQKIQTEVGELREEIGRIITSAEFNSRKIWDPNEADEEPIQIGTEMQPSVKMTMSANTSQNTITNVNRNAIANGNYRLTADATGIVVSWQAMNGNTYQSDVVPWPDGDATKSNTFQLADYLDTTANPELAGVDLTVSYTTNEYATASDVISGLNGVQIGAASNSSERLDLYDINGNTIGDFFPGAYINYDAEIVSNRDMESGDTSFMVGSATNMTQPASDSDKWTLAFQMDQIGTVTATSTEFYYYMFDESSGAEGTWWNWYNNGSTMERRRIYHWPSPNDGSLASLKYIVNNTNGVNPITDSNQSGFIHMSFSLTSANAFSNGGRTTNSVGSLSIDIRVTSSDTAQSILDKLNAIKGMDVYNSASSNADGASLSSRSTFGNYENTNGYNPISTPVFEYNGHIDRWVQAGANDGDGFDLVYRYLSAKVLGINNTRVDTDVGLSSAFRQIDGAMEIVAHERAIFGSYENRMEYSYKTNDIAAENLQDSESRIRDTDMADEISRLAKEQILEQAGISVLTQANQNPEGILRLING